MRKSIIALEFGVVNESNITNLGRLKLITAKSMVR